MITQHPGHSLTVTPGPFGRAYLECSCAMRTQVHPTKRSANRAGLRHHHDVGNGCTCPPEVQSSDIHPVFITTTSGAAS